MKPGHEAQEMQNLSLGQTNVFEQIESETVSTVSTLLAGLLGYVFCQSWMNRCNIEQYESSIQGFTIPDFKETDSTTQSRQ